MQIQARWKNGALYPVRPLHLKNNKLVTIEIAEDMLPVHDPRSDNVNDEHSSTINELLANDPDDAWLQKMKKIEVRIINAEEELPELTHRQLQNIDAFSLREDV